MNTREINVTIEDDATPLVRNYANTLRLTWQKPAGQKLLQGLKTRFALRSYRNAQALTFTINDKDIHIEHGVASSVPVVFTLDFARPEHVQATTGKFRHPLLSRKLLRLLALPLPPWTDSAKRFWQRARHAPHIPEALAVTCTDEDRTLNLGEAAPDSNSRAELQGRARDLEKLFAGSTVLVEEVIMGRIRAKSAFQYLAGLSQVGLQIRLGEPGE